MHRTSTLSNTLNSFGSIMEGRSYEGDTSLSYRYGFNGKEKDDETYGDGNEYDYGFRIYNPRLGKFLSVDPLSKNYPWYSPYQFSGNNPIKFIDLDGLEEADPMDDPLLTTRLILTTFFDVKHSLYNLVLTCGRASSPIGQLMPRIEAGYVKDASGNESFKTEFRIVQDPGVVTEVIGTGLDLINVISFGRGKMDVTDFISVKTKTPIIQATRAIRSAVIHKSTVLAKDKNLAGDWVERDRSKSKGSEYQSHLSGKPIINGKIEEFKYNKVDFDGYSNGILFEAKDGYGSWFKNNGQVQDWVKESGALDGTVKQANSQITAAAGNKLQWIFSDKNAGTNMRQYLKDQGVDVDKIEFKYVEKPSD